MRQLSSFSLSSKLVKCEIRCGRVSRFVGTLEEPCELTGCTALFVDKDLPQKGENKYIDSDSDDEKDTGKDSDAEIPAESSEEDEEEAFEEEAPKKRKSTGGKGKGRASAAVKPKANGTKPKAAPKKRKPKKAAGDEDGDVVTKGDYIVADDNELFSPSFRLLASLGTDVMIADAVKNPNASLESVVDDWIESYKNDAGPAMAQLVNFAFRVSGTSPYNELR